ncbi:hypothetical protein V1512DRAFT_291880 [Lipomyces arxii]|uniref:uncharacterized protein n=1 Tax=Lipomyces arxii TaxID=56418 RepID=UPI0034CF1C25
MSRLPDLLRVFDGAYLPSSENALILVMGGLSTSVSWLLQHFARACISGQNISMTRSKDVQQKVPVVFVSFMQDLEFYSRCFSKVGIDLTHMIAQKQIVFVDGFTGLLLGKPASKSPTDVFLNKDKYTTWIDTIRTEIFNLSPDIKPTLIIECLDVLHAMAVMTASEILHMIGSLQKLAGITIVSACSANSMLTGSTNLADQQDQMLLGLIRRAVAVFSLRPLSTGQAEDVTGMIRITRGGQLTYSGAVIDEEEYHYFVGNGGSGAVKVFVKGRS